MGLSNSKVNIREVRFDDRRKDRETVTIGYRIESEDQSIMANGTIRVLLEEYNKNGSLNSLENLVKEKLT
jgi:hypothetical protein